MGHRLGDAEGKGTGMRWSTFLMTSSRLAQVVVAFALVIVAEPGIEMILMGAKWT